MTADRVTAEIALLVYPGCQLAAVHGLTDLFRIASDWPVSEMDPATRPLFRVSHWAPEGPKGEPRCTWDSLPGTPHRIDYVIAPPSIIMPEEMPEMPGVARWIGGCHAGGSRVCSVCAGAFVLAEAGLIDGRRATTHWAFARQLAERYPAVDVSEDDIVLDDGDIITAGGILAWTDLGLTLVDRLAGPSVMLATARFLVVDPPGRLQSPYSLFVPVFDHGDAEILALQHHVHANAAEPHSLPELAERAGLGERTFLRRFVKATGLRPTEYIQQVRIAKAREALEHSNRSVDRIAWAVGYGDPAAFRKVFQRITGLTPASYRRRFGVA